MDVALEKSIKSGAENDGGVVDGNEGGCFGRKRDEVGKETGTTKAEIEG